MKRFIKFLTLGSLICLVSLLFSPRVALSNEVPPIKPPIIVTTCGQSPGAVMVKMSLMQAEIVPVESNNTIIASELKEKEYNTLIVTTGTSGKGMGAAGTNVNKEIARCKEVIAEAKKTGMLVITAHVEGMARRTDDADQRSIDEIMPLGDVMLVVADSNSDSYFSRLAEEHNIPLIEAKDALEIGAKLKEYAEVN